MARGSVGMRNQDGGTRDTGLSWRRGAGRARWGPCQAQELVAVMKRGACDAGRVELRPQQRVARVRGPARPRESSSAPTSLWTRRHFQGPGTGWRRPPQRASPTAGWHSTPRDSAWDSAADPVLVQGLGPPAKSLGGFSEDRGARAGGRRALWGRLLCAEAVRGWLG